MNKDETNWDWDRFCIEVGLGNDDPKPGDPDYVEEEPIGTFRSTQGDSLLFFAVTKEIRS